MPTKLQLKDELPRWLCDWLLSRGFAEEILEEEVPADGLRARLPNEADHVQGKRSGPRTENPE